MKTTICPDCKIQGSILKDGTYRFHHLDHCKIGNSVTRYPTPGSLADRYYDYCKNCQTEFSESKYQDSCSYLTYTRPDICPICVAIFSNKDERTINNAF